MGCTLATAPAAGAIAVIQLHGDDARHVAEQLCGFVPDHRVRLAQLVDIDEGLVAMVRPGLVQIMPHGGPRVVQRLLDWLGQRGVRIAGDIDPFELYPEADSPLEAAMLATISQAASPAAIDLLLDQPRRWRQAMEQPQAINAGQIVQFSKRLERLINPPTIALIGMANVGKSTLTNQLLGRAVSVVADLPGTTRDWVGGLAELTTPLGLVAVQWADTPGHRRTSDPIEQQAQQFAEQVVHAADIVVAMRDDQAPWPNTAGLDPGRVVWVVNKVDRIGDQPLPKAPDRSKPIGVSALDDTGLGALETAIIDRLGLTEAMAWAGPWAFCGPLRRAIDPVDPPELRRVVAG